MSAHVSAPAQVASATARLEALRRDDGRPGGARAAALHALRRVGVATGRGCRARGPRRGRRGAAPARLRRGDAPRIRPGPRFPSWPPRSARCAPRSPRRTRSRRPTASSSRPRPPCPKSSHRPAPPFTRPSRSARDSTRQSADRLGAAIREADDALARIEKEAARRPTATISALARMRDRLDLALGDARTAQQRLRGARTALPGTLAAARGAIAQAESSVSHAAAGADARVRLASARGRPGRRPAERRPGRGTGCRPPGDPACRGREGARGLRPNERPLTWRRNGGPLT